MQVLSDPTSEFPIPLPGDELAAAEGEARLPARVPSGVLVAAAAWTLYGVVIALVLSLVHRSPEYSAFILTTAFAQAVFWAAATPVIAWLARRVEPARAGWPLTVLIHAPVAILAAIGVVAMRRWAQMLLVSDMSSALLPRVLFWLDVNLLTYVTIVIVARALHLHRRYRRRAMRAHRLELQLARAKMQFLELQLQPHFLFNCLNAVSELAHEAPEAAERMLGHLRALLHVSLDRAGRDEVTLDEELAGLEPYLEIQRVRFSDWLSVEERIDVAARDALVPHLILQPLVENAIRHGLAVRSAPGTVWIEASIDQGRLRILVRDDGVGLGPTSPARRPGRTGIGLRNTRDRLRQLYDPEYRFALHAAPEGGTIVELDIPVRRRDASGRPPPLPAGRERASDVARDRIETSARGTLTRGSLALMPPSAPAWPYAATSDPDAPSALVTGGWAVARAPGRAVPSIGAFREPSPEPMTASDTAAESPETRRVPMRRITPRLMLALLLGWPVVGLVWTEQIYLFSLASMGEAVEVGPLLKLNMIAAGLWAIFTPIVLWLANRFRLGRDRGALPLVAHVVAALTLTTTHVALYTVLDGQHISATFVAANQNQLVGNVFIYCALVAWAHAHEFYAWYHERVLAASRIEAAIARSRYQSMCVQLRPQLLLGTLDRLERLVHEDVPRAERLIARLADLLRMTLDSASDAETTLRKELELLRAYAEVYQLGIREGLSLTIAVPAELLTTTLPNRLLRTIVDDMLAGLPLAASAWVAVDVERISRATRIHVHLDSESPRHRVRDAEPWSVSVEAAALAEADRRVSLFFPDSRSALLVLADDAPTAAALAGETDPVPAAQPA